MGKNKDEYGKGVLIGNETLELIYLLLSIYSLTSNLHLSILLRIVFNMHISVNITGVCVLEHVLVGEHSQSFFLSSGKVGVTVYRTPLKNDNQKFFAFIQW